MSLIVEWKVRLKNGARHISLKCTSDALFGWKLWKLWLALESNYHKQNYEECVIVRHRIKPQARKKKQLKMERTKMIGFERRNNTKPCYWNCVDTFNSAATTFSKTASHSLAADETKGTGFGGFCFYIQTFWFQRTMVFNNSLFLFIGADKWTMTIVNVVVVVDDSSFGSQLLLIVYR